MDNSTILYYLRRLDMLTSVPATFTPKKVLARGVCPLHDGADNPNAFLLFGDGFACQTNGCHKRKEFGSNLHGLVRHLVFRLSGKAMIWQEAWQYARNNSQRLKAMVAGKVRQAKQVERAEMTWSAEELAGCLSFPSDYYRKRGYRADTLAHFGVGTCVRELPDGNRLLGWPVFPVIERPDQNPLGYTARNPRWKEGTRFAKWMNAEGFEKSEVIYNYFAASRTRGPLVICEGPGCVLRFHEAGLLCAVATLGSPVSEQQYRLLRCLVDAVPGRAVYIAGDNDDVGRQFSEEMKRQIQSICLREPASVTPPRGKDFGDCTTEEVRAWAAGISEKS